MATSSITGVEDASAIPEDEDTSLFGPSDSSDSGSDALGTADASGSGERVDVEGDDLRDGADILPDHIVGPDSESFDPATTQEISGGLAADEILGEEEDGDEDAQAD